MSKYPRPIMRFERANFEYFPQTWPRQLGRLETSWTGLDLIKRNSSPNLIDPWATWASCHYHPIPC